MHNIEEKRAGIFGRSWQRERPCARSASRYPCLPQPRTRTNLAGTADSRHTNTATRTGKDVVLFIDKLRQPLPSHSFPFWSTRDTERKRISKYVSLIIFEPSFSKWSSHELSTQATWINLLVFIYFPETSYLLHRKDSLNSFANWWLSFRSENGFYRNLFLDSRSNRKT